MRFQVKALVKFLSRGMLSLPYLKTIEPKVVSKLQTVFFGACQPRSIVTYIKGSSPHRRLSTIQEQSLVPVIVALNLDQARQLKIFICQIAHVH